jgi:adenosylcobyric acid synthase
MFARRIDDPVESGRGMVDGLGLLPVDITFGPEKTLHRPHGVAFGQPITTAYEIHHGIARVDDGAADFPGGTRKGAVWGTHWHGLLDSDAFRRAFLTEIAAAAGRDFVPAPDTNVGALRSRRLDRLADLVGKHLDTEALRQLGRDGAPAGLPFVPPGAP